MAKNASPLVNFRLSMEMPAKSIGKGPARSACIAAAMVSSVQSTLIRFLQGLSQAHPGSHRSRRLKWSWVCIATLRVAMRSGHAGRAGSCHFALQGRCHGLVVRERHNAIADDLPGLVALARDQQHVAGLELRNSHPNSLGTIANFCGTRRFGENGTTDCGRVFAAWVVIGNDDAVGIL